MTGRLFFCFIRREVVVIPLGGESFIYDVDEIYCCVIGTAVSF